MNYQRVMELERKRRALLSARDVLEWDERVTMPENGIDVRAEQYKSISSIAHEILVSDDFGQALAEAEKEHDLTEVQRANLRELRMIRDREVNVPTELVEEIAGHSPKSYEAWSKAKRNSDFSAFAPLLDKFVELMRRKADEIDPNTNPYEVLVQEYEPGATLEMLRAEFAKLKARVVPLFARIRFSDVQPNLRFFNGYYPVTKQDSLNEMLARKIGFDFKSGRLDGRADSAFHPFTIGSCGDVRITTRYLLNNPVEALLSTVHEAGHAMYEQGLPKEHALTPAGCARSLGVHESQSRLWENHVGKSLAFWQWFFPELKEAFQCELSDYSAESFYAAVNNVEPDLIRVESNEVTYNLHVLLRFEIEDDLINGRIEVKDLPEVWNAKMVEYIGVVPSNDAEGVLQDVHWCQGMFGYFPTYTLGTMWAAQIFNAAERNIPNLEDNIRAGEFSLLKAWLNENIHAHGSLLLTDELIMKATGKAHGADDFIAYLETKFTDLYNIE